MAFLPHSAVKKELRAGKLVSAAPADAVHLQMAMEVRAYREKPNAKEVGNTLAQSLWNYLQSQTDVAHVED